MEIKTIDVDNFRRYSAEAKADVSGCVSGKVFLFRCFTEFQEFHSNIKLHLGDRNRLLNPENFHCPSGTLLTFSECDHLTLLRFSSFLFLMGIVIFLEIVHPEAFPSTLKYETI